MGLFGNFWVGTMQNNIAPDGTSIDIKENSGAIYSIDKNFIGYDNRFYWYRRLEQHYYNFSFGKKKGFF